jgi:hypothetical protein
VAGNFGWQLWPTNVASKCGWQLWIAALAGNFGQNRSEQHRTEQNITEQWLQRKPCPIFSGHLGLRIFQHCKTFFFIYEMLLASASVEALPNFFLAIQDLEYFSIAKYFFPFPRRFWPASQRKPCPTFL